MVSSVDLKLSEKELVGLFKISQSSLHAIHHDLKNPLSVIRRLAEILLTLTPESEDKRIVEHILSAAIRALRIIDIALPKPREAYDEELFAADPFALIQLIRKDYQDAAIRVGDHDPSLRIIYPTQPLFIVINELISNAIRHAGDAVEVIVSWEVRNRRFVFSIEDSGKGLSRDLSSAYLPLDALTLEIHAGGGLDAVWRVVRASGGLLLFRRSMAFGGTQALIDIPILGYWQDKELRLFRHGHDQQPSDS